MTWIKVKFPKAFWSRVCILFVFLSLIIFPNYLVGCSNSFEPGKEDSPSDLSGLPVDTGGAQVIKRLGESSAPYGYHVYFPSGYNETNLEYPLLVFLHGTGERGNSQDDSSAINKVLRGAIPALIKRNKWDPASPMVVLSPQCHESWWNSQRLHELIEYSIETHRINTSRIYMTGISMGGFGSFSYVESYADSSFVAAIVPIAGGGNPKKANALVTTPVWAFHGEADSVVRAKHSIEMYQAVKKVDPNANFRLTLYPEVGHNSWGRTYDGSGMGVESKQYDSFNVSVFLWMLQHKK